MPCAGSDRRRLKAAGDEETLKMIDGAMKAGAAGLSMGRNAFQHEKPAKFVAATCAMVHEGISAKEALKMIRS